MSNKASRAPRKDIALLRKLKDPNFSPSALLDEGSAILDRANKLKGFVSVQRDKLGAGAVKTEWLLVHQQLAEEQATCEAELASTLQQLVEHQFQDAPELVPCIEELRSVVDSCRATRVDLRAQAKGLAAAAGSVRAYGGPARVREEAASLKQEISLTRQDLDGVLAELAGSVQALSSQVKDAWPSALSAAGDPELDAAGGSGGGLSNAAYDHGRDAEELEQMISRYPLAAGDVKCRVRQVFAALTERFAERLDAWRLDAERVAASLSGSAGPSGAGPNSAAGLHGSPHHHHHNARRPAGTVGPLLPAVPGAAAQAALGRPPVIPGAASSSGSPGPGPAGGRLKAMLPVVTPPSASASTGVGTAGRSGSSRGTSPTISRTPSFQGSLSRPLSGSSPSQHIFITATGTIGGADGAQSQSVLPAPSSSSSASDAGTEGTSSVAAAALTRSSSGRTRTDTDACSETTSTVSTPSAVTAQRQPQPAAQGCAASWRGAVAAVPSAPASSLLSGLGGWAADEHSMFVKHRERLMKEQQTKLNREAIMSKISALLPGRTAAQVLSHDDWYTAARLAARRRRDLVESWPRERRQFIEDSAMLLQESATLIAAEAEAAAHRLARELVREKVHGELDELREHKAQQDAAEAAAAAERRAREEACRAAAAAAEQQERQMSKQLLVEYWADLQRQQEQQRAEAEAEARREAEAATVAARHNKERVEWRQAEFLVKVDEQKRRDAAAAAEEAARVERLERLRALVAPDVAADPQRLVAPTAATAAVADKVAGAFNPVNGFTTEQVYRDQRVKLLEALKRQGLHTTDYGRQVIAAARPAIPTRPDNMTSEQRMPMIPR